MFSWGGSSFFLNLCWSTSDFLEPFILKYHNCFLNSLCLSHSWLQKAHSQSCLGCLSSVLKSFIREPVCACASSLIFPVTPQFCFCFWGSGGYNCMQHLRWDHTLCHAIGKLFLCLVPIAFFHSDLLVFCFVSLISAEHWVDIWKS